MRVLLVSSFLIFRETRFGGSKRIYNIALDLEQEHDLSVICFDGNLERAGWNGRPEFGKLLCLDTGVPGKPRRRWSHYLDAGPEMRRQGKALEAFLSEGGFDCVILAYGYAPNLLRFPQVSACRRIVYIEGDLALVQADAARKAAKALPAKIIKEIRYRQISRNYRDFLGKIGTFFIYTRTEISEVNRRFPAVKTMQLTMGMELAGIIPLPPSQEAGVAGFLGNFQHPPNPDAVHWYLEKVHPILVARHPDYRLLIAGMNIPRGIAEKAETDRALILLGPVEALETFYRVVSFTVNPIVSGKGIRTKVLESAAYGRAIVSTTLGADGTDPLEVLIGDGPEAFAECCSRFLARPAAQAAIDRNREIVGARFSGSAVLERLLG